MKILEGHEKEYKDWYDKNSDGYGRACFTFCRTMGRTVRKEDRRIRR